MRDMNPESTSPVPGATTPSSGVARQAPIVALNQSTLRLPWTKRGINSFYKENFGWYIFAIIPLMPIIALVVSDGGFFGKSLPFQVFLIGLSAWMVLRNVYRYRSAFRPRHAEQIAQRNSELMTVLIERTGGDPYMMSLVFDAVLNGGVNVYDGTIEEADSELRTSARARISQVNRCDAHHPTICRHNNPGIYAWMDQVTPPLYGE